jgi:glutathione S-transferase
MSLVLYGHPFSSYVQKVLTALYENATRFEFKMLSPEEPAHGAEFARLWPMRKMPLLVDDGTLVRESTVIIEHLDLHHHAVKMLPADPRQALEVRFLDRIFDQYVMTPMQAIVADFIRPAGERDPVGVAQAHELLDRAYAWLETVLPADGWAAGGEFGLADCAAAPSLFYADWVHPIAPSWGRLQSYRGRLLRRPSFARAVDEARLYRTLFPPGAPDRD